MTRIKLLLCTIPTVLFIGANTACSGEDRTEPSNDSLATDENSSSGDGNSNAATDEGNESSGDASSYLSSFDISYELNQNFVNPNADVDGRIHNNSSSDYKNFVLKIVCYNEEGEKLETIERTVDRTIESGEDKSFTVSFPKVKKTASVKVTIVRASKVS